MEPLSFYQNVSPSKKLREASNEAEKHIESSGKKLNPEEQRLVDKMVLDGARAGLGLPEADREQLKGWKKELSQVCLEFNVSVFNPSAHGRQPD
jgi:Zn-dependent oligopeptidase